MSAEKIKELKSAIEYHEDQTEIMRHVGYKECAANHCRRVKELKVHLMLND